MSNEHEQKYIYIDGQAVPVSDAVYHAYWHYANKEDYFTRQLKGERIEVDQEQQKVTFIPGREDSYERLLETDHQFASQGYSVEERVVMSVWMEEVLSILTEDERYIVCQIYFERRSERSVSKELGISKTALHHRKTGVLRKLKNFLEKFQK